MKIIKTIVLAAMLIIIASIAYLNNLHTTVNNDSNNENIVCDEVYYHPTYTFRKNGRNSPSQGLYWLTTDKDIISPLLIMPGMNISLTTNDNGSNKLMYSQNSGQSITVEEADYLKQQIPELEMNGDSVIATDFYGYDEEQLIKISSDQMLGQASACKENNDQN